MWDCATGNGQAAVSCTRYFSQVDATDISAEQIKHCLSNAKINYTVSPAETTAFADNSFDLIMVAQALHWFNQEKFFQEAERVLKPNGILAIFGYAFFEIAPDIDTLIYENLLVPIDRFWAKGNRLLISGYKDVTMPFEEIIVPQNFAMQVEWTQQQLLEYLRTWSAVKRFTEELGVDPVARLESKIKPFWKDPEKAKPVKMPLFVRASRKSIA